MMSKPRDEEQFAGMEPGNIVWVPPAGLTKREYYAGLILGGAWLLAFWYMTFDGPVYIHQRQCKNCYLLQEIDEGEL